MSEETPNTVADEAKRQLVILLFTLVGAAGVVFISMHESNPAVWGRAKMRAARWMKKVSVKVADASLRVSDKADALYEKSRG